MKKFLLALLLAGSLVGQNFYANVCEHTYLDIVPVIQKLGFVVTATTRGRHNTNSKHYLGKAVDVRTRDKSDSEISFLRFTIEGMGYVFRDERERPMHQRVWSAPHVHISIPDCVVPTFYDTPVYYEEENMCETTNILPNSFPPKPIDKQER